MVRSNFCLLVFWVLLLGWQPAVAQLGPVSDPAQAPQARTQEEFDQYLQIVMATDPRQVIQQVETFARAFPDSQLLGIAWQYQMHAFQQINDFDGLLLAGTKALAANPDNLNTLLTLAPALANAATQRPDRQSLLAQAQTYATSALAAIDKTKLPREVPFEHWQVEKKKMQAQAHETLGVVALDEKDDSRAIQEFESAIALQPDDGAAFLRLGVAYVEARRIGDAKQTLRRAAELGPDAVRALALNQIKVLAEQSSPAK